MYQLKNKQFINASIEEVWSFISSPNNLQLITPPEMDFKVLSEDLPNKIYPGMIIKYRVKPLLNIPSIWVTEITQVKENNFFVDEQRVGPYKIWHHQHIIEKKDNGTLMSDIVSYIPPFGPLGKIANSVIIEKKLEHIFNYREKKINELFN